MNFRRVSRMRTECQPGCGHGEHKGTRLSKDACWSFLSTVKENGKEISTKL